MIAEREADLRLRTTQGPLSTRVWWPRLPAPDTGVLMLFVDEAPDVLETELRALASRERLVVIAVPCALLGEPALDNAMTALEWAAEHGRELEADPARLLVGGTGACADMAAATAKMAREQGWPEVAELSP